MEGKTIRVRCSTWDQVESFYSEKLKGNILVVKMPFRPGIGESITVALSLPDGLVFAIDGTVVKIGGEEAGRMPVAVRLLGMTPEVRTQLKRLVAQGRGQTIPRGSMRAVGTLRPHTPRGPAETVPPSREPTADDVPEDERGAWSALSATRERILTLSVYEVLGLPPDADPASAHGAFLALALRVHPDRFRRYRSRSMRALAAEAFVHLAHAYERLLAPAAPGGGWLLELGDGSEPPISDGVPSEPMQASGSSPYSEPYSELSITAAPTSSPSYEDDVSFTTSVRMRALTAEDLFDEEPTGQAATPAPEQRPQPAVLGAELTEPAPVEERRRGFETAGRTALAEARWREACEAFAAYLRLEPKDRAMRALYHVANGMDLRSKGEGVKARLQFETALAHDRDCEPAQRALVHEGGDKKGLFKRLFDK